ncbi:hypothetical protein [Mycobacteroides abscessus]|uniref:Uncharacterized protein n=1 Tax=Mycobacteroides abscessus TaxID=36809 RepID=A0ABD7HQ00_9MYCO|nr:hypothetical protein [Mycobacteroides abscessus]RIQ98396.1 hypothetical protein D2E35_18970 [Mycobacteroides abscessus]RIR47743.1 hypothetical protein D2E39_06555 [Mycobacteroides abscessus]RIT40067.1 hypothetical protein D2E76_09645 [Mycobacteroides abscessus]
MSAPHVRQEDRDAIDDRGLVDDDRTEDLVGPAVPAPIFAADSRLDGVALPVGALFAEQWERSPGGRGWFRWWRGRVFPVATAGRELAVRCGGVQMVEDSGRAVVVRTIDVSPQVGSVTPDVAAQLSLVLGEAAQYTQALKATDPCPSAVIRGIPCSPIGSEESGASGVDCAELIATANRVGIAASSLLGPVLSRSNPAGPQAE